MTPIPQWLAVLVIAAAVTPCSAQGIMQTDGAISSAARTAATIGIEWLGPHPAAEADVTVRPPVWQGAGAMWVEQQTAQRVLRSWWPGHLADAQADAILDGFAWYLQTQAIEHEFDLRYLRTAHSAESRHYIGNHIIWSFPTLRLSRDAAATAGRYAAVFAALERWIGMPTLQGAMFEVAHLPAGGLTATTIVATLSDAAGQDLSWAFEAAAAGADVNYAVTALSSADAAGCAVSCVDTTVAVARRGDGRFAGRTAERVGAFDSGDALLLKVLFADGTQSSVSWDGRDQARTFAFRGPSRATAAYLDPDRIVMPDRNRLDNARVTPAPTNVPTSKWVARWVVWLQHTMLSYGFLA